MEYTLRIWRTQRVILANQINFRYRLIDAAPFPVLAAVLSFFSLALSLGVVAYFLNVSAARENEVAFRESRHIVETAFSFAKRDLSNLVKDYAWWDDTVQNTTGNVDLNWAEDNIGNYLQNSFDVTGSFVVSPALETVFYSPRTGPVIDDAIAFLGKNGQSFLKNVQSASLENSVSLTTFVRTGDSLFVIAAAAITKERPTGQELVAHPRPVLILYNKFDDELIDEMSHQFLLRDLSVSFDAPVGASAYIPLSDEQGDIVAYINWTPGKPGDQLFAELLPNISLVTLLLFATALLVFFAWWRTASQANAEKYRFFAKMSHELRTPLNPIIGFSNLMSHETMGPIPATYKGYAEDIHQCGIHLSAIIEDMLNVSRIEAGEMSLNETDFDVTDLIENFPAFFKRMPNADILASPELVIRRDIEGNLPKLRADQVRIQQVLLNLISNAVKFSDGKEIVIRAANDNGCIVIRVEDHGVGISEKDMKLLFRPFAQVGNQTIETRSHGSGLGLVVIRELMRLHGGDFSLESEAGKGTVATVRFPSSRSV